MWGGLHSVPVPLIRVLIMNYKLLSFAIIDQAIQDYRKLKASGLSTLELENFFKSEWCDWLLLNVRLSGVDILARLESE